MKVSDFARLLYNQKLIQCFFWPGHRTGKADMHHLVFNCYGGAEHPQNIAAKRIYWEWTTVAITYQLFTLLLKPRVLTKLQKIPFPPQHYTTPNCGAGNSNATTNATAWFTYCNNPQCQYGVYSCTVSEPACPDKIPHKYTKATKEFFILNTLLICTFLFTLEMTFLNTVWSALDQLTLLMQ